MKGLIVLLIVALVAACHAQNLSQEQLTKLKAHYEKCTKDTGVNVELILKGRKGEFTKDEKLAKYYFCMFNQVGILNDNGDLVREVAIAKKPQDVSDEEIDKVLNACKDKKGADKYETAQKLYECYYTTSPKHISFA